MPDFLLELLSEEIPARMQPRARGDLARLFAAELAKSGLKADSVETFSTPRRLALIARDLPPETLSASEELKGPRTSAPPQALEGFLRKTGFAQGQLTDRDGVWFAVLDKPGRATSQVLAEAIPAIVRAFPWPKSMRWGEASASTESLRWVRPLQGVVALFGGDIVPFEIDGIHASAETVGHRFHHPGRITIGSADDYAAKLRACHVIVDHEEREAIIATGATTLAAQAGLTLVRDEVLLTENAGLTEWPVPLLGRFDESYLQVPPEVIQLTMAVNQKYFALHPLLSGEGRLAAGERGEADGSSSPSHSLRERAPPSPEGRGNLAPAFICTANLDPRDRGLGVVAGNQKVLAARLSDAKFFWEQDLKVPLESQAKKLDQIVFHEKLGTVADKVERVAKLARWLVEEGIVSAKDCTPAKAGAQESHEKGLGPGLRRDDEENARLAGMAETAARLCKADLVTGMVGEFPELQGVMGGYYARAQGLPDEVADAIRDHYKPVGQGDEVPTAPVTVAVSLADKLDTLMAFFAIDQAPTGSRDPFALRRAAIATIALILTNSIRLEFQHFLSEEAGNYFKTSLAKRHGDVPNLADYRLDFSDEFWIGYEKFLPFLIDRLKVQQREAGVRHDLIDAVFALGGEDDLVRLLARVKALQAFVETPEGRDLLAGYKRAANILKKENWPPQPSPLRGEGQPGAAGQGEGQSEAAPDSAPLPGRDAAVPLPGGERVEKKLSYSPALEEQSLITALDSVEPRARAAVEAEDFEGAMTALAELRAPVDAFFDRVTVNDENPDKRRARLALLARIKSATEQVADFSRIDG